MPSQSVSAQECSGPRLSHREFFDRVAVTWDDEVKVDPHLVEHILSYAAIRPGESVLDVGCGTGLLLPYLLTLISAGGGNVGGGSIGGGRIFALDISEGMLSRARRKYGGDPRVSFLLASAEDIPLADGSCQVVVCFSAFPHFPDKGRAMAEMARVLSPGGRLLIAHAEGRERINLLHARIGGAVAGDQLPEASHMAGLVATARLRKVAFIDRDDLYVLLARKPLLAPRPLLARPKQDFSFVERTNGTLKEASQEGESSYAYRAD